MDHIDACSGGLPHETDLHRAGPRRELVGSHESPAEHDPIRWVERLVTTPNGRALDIDRELAPGPRVEQRVLSIQRTIASARVKYSYTSWGSASTNTEVVSGSAAIALPRLHVGLETFQALRPQLREESPDGVEAFGADDVEPALAFGSDRHEARVLQDLQVLGDGLLADVEVSGDLVDRARPVADEQQHRPAPRLRQRREGRFGRHAPKDNKTCLVQVVSCRVLVRDPGDDEREWPMKGGTVSSDVRELVSEYVLAAGDRRFDRFEELLHPDVEFGGTTVVELRGASAVAEGYRRLGPIILRNDVKQMVVDGDKAFVLYDFVTDTAVGPVLTGELLTVDEGRIRSIVLLFDWRRWPEVLGELERRSAA